MNILIIIQAILFARIAAVITPEEKILIPKYTFIQLERFSSCLYQPQLFSIF